MTPKKPLAVLISAAGLTLLCPQANADSIGLNFVNNDNNGIQNGSADSLGAAEVAGAPGYTQSNWNNLARWGDPTPVVNSAGAGTSVSAAWDSLNTWGTGVGTATPDHKLMVGYVDSNGAVNVPATSPYSVFGPGENKPQVYLTGLSGWLAASGGSSYNIILYVDGDATDGRTGEYWAQAASGPHTAMTLGGDLTPHYFLRDTANFGGTYDQLSASATSAGAADDANYLVLSGLTADSLLIRTEETNTRSPINGIQIVSVPEPATAGLLGLGAAGLALIRRRRSRLAE